MKIYLGSDHAGTTLKEKIKKELKKDGYLLNDLSPETPEGGDDYPDYAFLVGEAVAHEKDSIGILICDTGIGMSIAANKVTGARAALVHDIFTAKRSREHNDANIIVFASNTITVQEAITILKYFFETFFSQSERHIRRIGKIEYYEKHHSIPENE